MAAADELYLLFQQCKDLKDKQISDWEKHFQWLEEIVSLSNEAHGAVFPKTPMNIRKAKKKKVEPDENEDPSDAFFEPPKTAVRTSSRAAAKNASKKISMLEEISNVKSKLRQPSSPPKVSFSSSDQQIKAVSSKINGDIVDKSERCIPAESDNVPPVQMKCELQPNSKFRSHSCRSDSGVGTETLEEDNESIIVKQRCKQIEEKVPNTETSDILTELPNEHSKSELLTSNRPKLDIVVEEIICETGGSVDSKDNQESDGIKGSENKLYVIGEEYLHTESSTNEFSGIVKMKDNLTMPPPDIICLRPENLLVEKHAAVRTMDTLQLEEDNKPVRSTRTKKRPVEEHIEKSTAAKIIDNLHLEENSKPIRSTRTKKRPVEEKTITEERPSRPTRTKKRKADEEAEIDQRENFISGPSIGSHQVVEGSKRMTRSKVRQIIKGNSPTVTTQPKKFESPKPEIGAFIISSPCSERKGKSSQKTVATIGSPLYNKCQDNRIPAHKEVTEMPIVDVVAHSPIKIIKHCAVNEATSLSGKASQAHQPYQTPTKSSLYKARIQSLYNSNSNLLQSGSVLSSGSLHSVLQHKRPFLSSSSPNVSISRIGTAEHNRTKNIISGVPSFITNVQTSKPTKEEAEERKLEELKRKNEREEERRRKMEDMLKAKMEEHKRKNEERMRRVQETREARERKEVELRQKQEKERRMKEERLKEEKKKYATSKKFEEATKLQKLKDQEEKQKQLEEQRKIEEKQKEEQKRAEEKQRDELRKADLKLKEELRKADLRLKEEQRRAEEKLKEEQRKAEEKKKEEEKRAEEKLKEEKKRIEEKQKEDQRKAAEKKKEEQRKVEEEKRQKLEEQKRTLEQKREREQLAKEEYERHKAKEQERIEREKRELQLLQEKDSKNNGIQNETFTAEPKEHISNATFTQPSEASNPDSYNITPVAKKTTKKSKNPDDYNIGDLGSDDSTDEEGAPKKQIPLWAKGDLLRKNLFNQEYYPPTIDDIFPPQELLLMPELSTIFTVQSREQKIKFNKRTSSAVWDTPPYKIAGKG